MMPAKHPLSLLTAWTCPLLACLLMTWGAFGCDALKDPVPEERRSPDATRGGDDVHSPDVHSPDVYSPDVHSPDVHSPDVHSPDVSDEPPIFHPTDIAGLSLFFDADQLETLTMSSEGRVSVWRDLSGQDNHAYQASDRLMPIHRAAGPAGRGVLEFDKSYLTTSDPLQLRATGRGYTIFAVALNTVADGVSGDEGRGGVLLGNYRRPHSSFAVELHHDRRLRQWWDRREEFGQPTDGYRGDGIFEAPRPDQDAYAMLTFFLDTQTQTVGVAVDGEFAAPLPDEGFVYEVQRPLRIGADYRELNLPTAWKGSIGALLVYDRYLSASEMDLVHRHLSLEWEIPLRH